MHGSIHLAKNYSMLVTTLELLENSRFNCTVVAQQSKQTSKDWMTSLCTFPSSGAGGLGFLTPSI